MAFHLTGGNIHDRRAAIPTLEKMVKVGKRRYPNTMAADKGYDSLSLRQELRQRGIRNSIPERVYKKAKRRRKGRPPLFDQTLGKTRWIVERTFGWLNNRFRRLKSRWETLAIGYTAFCIIAFIIICLGRVLK